jgi:hypothetical protein
MTTWWLSFSGDGRNLGICIVDAHSFPEAVMVAHILGINPGGEVRGWPMHGDVRDREVARWGKERLIPREELAAGGGMLCLKDGAVRKLEP